jgi:hypothetical protein
MLSVFPRQDRKPSMTNQLQNPIVPVAPDAGSAPIATPAPAPVPAVPGPPPARPVRGWLIAILACLVVSLVIQAVTLALLVPHLVTSTRAGRAVTLTAISTGADGSVTISSGRSVSIQSITNGAKLQLPIMVAADETAAITVAAGASAPRDARITCAITDVTGTELATVSSVVGDNPTVTCVWTNKA